MAWKMGTTEGGDRYFCPKDDCRGKAMYHLERNCSNYAGDCYCGKPFEFCANCRVEFCRNFMHIKHICVQKPGDIKYFPPYPPKKVAMADISMYPDVTKTPKTSAPMPMITTQVEAFLAKKERDRKRVGEACSVLSDYNFNKKGDPKNAVHQKLALRINHIWLSLESGDDKKLARIYRHIIRKEKEFLTCVKAFVVLCKLSRYDAMLYRGSVTSFLHDVARVNS